MGKVTGFMEYTRETPGRRPVADRIKDWFEIYQPFPEESIKTAVGARCMDCGVPFCHTGCPVNNIIPDWNDMVFSRPLARGRIRVLHSTNNFPEFTGCICPAPCEGVLRARHPTSPPSPSRTSRRRLSIARGKRGWIVPEPAARKTGKRIAVVGSGPAGLAAAQQLARAGHAVTVFEKRRTASAPACCATASLTSRWRST